MESTSHIEAFNYSVGILGSFAQIIQSMGQLTLTESVELVGKDKVVQALLSPSPQQGLPDGQGSESTTSEAMETFVSGHGAVLREVFSTLLEKAEAVERRAELFLPESRENFMANLWWMTEQGMEEDLYAVRRLKASPPYWDDDIEEIMKIAEERILKRVNEPDYVVKNGEDAYRNNQKRWDDEYEGQFIAIYGRRVVANAATEDELWPKVKEAQNERGPFRAYIIKVGLEAPVFRGPLSQLAKSFTGEPSAEEKTD